MQQTDYTPLITRVTDSLGKTITDKQIARLHAEFNRIGLNKATEVVRRVERMQSLPNNIVGLILNIIDEVNEEFNKKLDTRTKWQADELCTSPDEFEWFFRVIALVMKIHADDKLPRNNAGLAFVGPDLDTWVRMGRPATWSPLIDQFLPGFEKVYKTNALLEYMKRFYQFLKDTYK